MNFVNKTIKIYTDGACSGNPGPGGAAAIVILEDINKLVKLGKFEKETTNQRMELTGIYLGLTYIVDSYHNINEKNLMDTHIQIYSDSAYCINAFNQNWIINWKRSGWENSKKQPVANQDLWLKIDRSINLLRRQN